MGSTRPTPVNNGTLANIANQPNKSTISINPFCTNVSIYRVFVIIIFVIGLVLQVRILTQTQYEAVPRLILKNSTTSYNSYLEEALKNKSLRGYPRRLCQCAQTSVLENKTSLGSGRSVSSCSDEATDVGPNQKILSYSLYVNDASSFYDFLRGIEPNMKLIEKLYPTWLVRIYTNYPIKTKSCSLICKHDKLYWCDITRIPQWGNLSSVNGRVWRFLPIGDSSVHIFVSRDLDSIPSERERVAVTEWEMSDKTFHVMRDHQWHSVSMLAGMWGAKTHHLMHSGVGKKLQEQIMQAGKEDQRKGHDQNILRNYIYQVYFNETLAHDSYFCKVFPDSLKLPFPTQRIGNEFVGFDRRKQKRQILSGRKARKRNLKACPIACRPEIGKNWTYC